MGRENESRAFNDARFKKAKSSEGCGACVEVAAMTDGFVVRDSKNPDGPVMRPVIRGWFAFLGSVTTGKVDWPR